MVDVNANSMKMKFPEFEAQPNERIEFAIEEAGRNVDDTWLDADRNLAHMYLAAHYLSVSITRASTSAGQAVVSERIGEISVTYAQPQQAAGDITDLSTTSYGARFLELARLNFPAIAVI